MTTIYHSPETLMSHTLYKKHGKQLEQIAIKDYERDGYFSGVDIPGIDLDEYEKALHTGNLRRTADTVIGIAELNGIKLSNHQLLLIEFRMLYKNAHNLSYSEILGKYTHSRELLMAHSSDHSVSPSFILVFNSDVVSPARSVIDRWRRGSNTSASKNWFAHTDRSLCQHINYGEKIPTPVSPELENTIKRWTTKKIATLEDFDQWYEEIKSIYNKVRGIGREVDIRYLQTEVKSLLINLPLPATDAEYFDLIKSELLEYIA